MTDLRTEIANDPEIAWAWHCNIAVPLMDSLDVDHRAANQTAAYLMSHLFGVDVTTDERFEYTKGPAQLHHEFMMQADGR